MILTKIENEYKELSKAKARESFQNFVAYTYEGYEMVWFHKLVCAYLEALYRGDIKKLMIFIPPQHGKSELSSRRFPAWCIGQDPSLKIGLLSYSQDLASAFNRDMQKIIEAPEYAELFPKTNLAKDLANSKIMAFEGAEGSIKTVGMLGGITGNKLDIGIIDDPFKNRLEANSPTIRGRVWQEYQDSFCTRLHNNSKVLMLFTRWHEDDPAGRILDPSNPCYDAQEASEWTVIALSALKEGSPPISCAKVVQDPRKIGEALWENRHSAEKYIKRKRINPVGFASLDQQRPAPLEGNMIKHEWFNVVKHSELPFNPDSVTWDCFIDGAWTDKLQNDQTALLTCYHDKKKNILYISSCIGIRKNLDDFLKFFASYAEGVKLKAKSTLYIDVRCIVVIVA